VRVFRASAHPDTPDKQGRVTVPAPLRAYAQLDKECTVIGNGNKLEVWDSTAWNTYLAEVMPAYSSYSVDSQEVVPGL
jgi:MraZ protein